MKTGLIILLCAFVSIECRSTRPRVPLDKHANVDFINMETGGGVAPKQSAAVTPVKPAQVPVTPNAKPMQPNSVPEIKPNPVQPAPVKPAAVQPAPVKPAPIQPVPVQPAPVAKPATTPGPGSVKQLVNFYDSQGKHSVIRPYSYSDAVKKGKTA